MRQVATGGSAPSLLDHVAERRRRRAVEHLLEGLSRSPGGSRLAVRGCWSFVLWFGDLHRATRGLDLVDHGGKKDPAQLLREACPPHRGMAFDWGGATSRRSGSGWTEHLEITVLGHVDDVPTPLRVVLAPHVGGVAHVEHLRMRPVGARRSMPLVACMTREWLVAEKTALLVTYGPDHSRIRDILDLWVLMRRFDMDGPSLAMALRAVFDGRDAARMLGRRDGYWESAFDRRRVSRAQCSTWEEVADSAYRIGPIPGFHEVLNDVADFLVPPLTALRDTGMIRGRWTLGSGWFEAGLLEQSGEPQQRLPLLASMKSSNREWCSWPSQGRGCGTASTFTDVRCRGFLSQYRPAVPLVGEDSSTEAPSRIG